MNVNKALATYFNKPGRKTLFDFITDNTPLVETYIRQFDKASDAETNLTNKFKAEYKLKNPLSKRSPPTAYDFDSLWSSTQLNKTLTNERNKTSVLLAEASGADVRTRLKEQKMQEDGSGSDENNDRNDSDDSNDSNNSNDSNDSNGSNSSDASYDVDYLHTTNENDEGAPAFIQEFKSFQTEAEQKAQTVGLFVNADLHYILSLYNTILLNKGYSHSRVVLNNLHKEMLELYKCDTEVDKKIFGALTELFRKMDVLPDREILKIKLFKIYEEADKQDRKIIDVVINLLNKLPNDNIIDHIVEEQELINNFIDPVLSPLLHNPEKNNLFLWLDKKVSKNLNTRPDGGCAIIQERRIEKFVCFAEVKAEYKKKDTLSMHQDLLRLAIFGINELNSNNAACILLIQVIGAVIVCYGCVQQENEPNIIFEVLKIKIPTSIQDLPAFIMSLDSLKALSNFYANYCTKKNNANGVKRKAVNFDLDKVVNVHKPKNLKVSIDF